MNKDQVNGRAETLKGDVKEAAGKLVGNERLKAEGQAEQAAGKVQSKVGDVKSDVGSAIKNAIDRGSIQGARAHAARAPRARFQRSIRRSR